MAVGSRDPLAFAVSIEKNLAQQRKTRRTGSLRMVVTPCLIRGGRQSEDAAPGAIRLAFGQDACVTQDFMPCT